MRILHIITKAEHGGAQVHVLGLILNQLRQGHEVFLLTGTDGFLVDMATRAGAQTTVCHEIIHPIRPVHDLKAILKLRHRLQLLIPDIVHAHSSKAGILARISCKLLRIPCVFTAHGWAFSEGAANSKRWVGLAAEWLIALMGQRIINVSCYDMELAKRYKIGRPTQHCYIHNGLPDEKSELNCTKNTIIMVARFATPKRQDLLIKAFAAMENQQSPLLLVGDGPQLQACKQLASNLGINNKVIFLGNSSEVPHLLRLANIFVLLSDHEGLPLTIIEAMRAGVPVVASNVGGIKELVEDGKTGYLLARDATPLHIAAILQKLLNNPHQARTMGVAGRQRFLAHFTEEHMMQNIDLVYKEALKP